MAISQQEFERVRRLLGEALVDEFDQSFEAPLEIEPGRWRLWPGRRVSVNIDETHYWNYGVPTRGTGNLQIQVGWPYSNVERLKPSPPSAPIGPRFVKKVLRVAKQVAKDEEKRTGYDLGESRLAYQLGYWLVAELPEDERAELLRLRDNIKVTGDWEIFWSAVADLKAVSEEKYVGIWDVARASDKLIFGVNAALDDYARGFETTFREPFPRGVPPGVKEWRPW